MKLLIVEDEPAVATIIRHFVSDIGLDARIAPTAEAADGHLAEEEFEAVTLDLGMPDRSGLDWLKQLAEEKPELARRTLVITGREPDSEIVDQLVECGAGLLMKPFRMHELQSTVKAQLARPIHRQTGQN